MKNKILFFCLSILLILSLMPQIVIGNSDDDIQKDITINNSKSDILVLYSKNLDTYKPFIEEMNFTVDAIQINDWKTINFTDYELIISLPDCLQTDPVEFGNTAANYLDQGGRFIATTFSWQTGCGGNQGRYQEDWSPWLLTNQYNQSEYSGENHNNSIILDGVDYVKSRYTAGSSEVTLFNDTEVLAFWDSGAPMIAVKDSRSMGLNFIPYYFEGDMKTLFQNAISYILNTPNNDREQKFGFDLEFINNTISQYDNFYFNGYIRPESNESYNFTDFDFQILEINYSIYYIRYQNETTYYVTLEAFESYFDPVTGYFEFMLDSFDELMHYDDQTYFIEIELITNYNLLKLNYQFDLLKIAQNDVFDIDIPNYGDKFHINDNINVRGKMNTNSNDLEYQLVINQLFVREQEISVNDYVIFAGNSFYRNQNVTNLYEFQSSFRIYDSNPYDDFQIFGNISIIATLIFDFWDDNYIEIPISFGLEIINNNNNISSIEIYYNEEIMSPNDYFFLEGIISDPKPYWVDIELIDLFSSPYIDDLDIKLEILYYNYSESTGEFRLEFTFWPQDYELIEYTMNISLILYYDGYELYVPIDLLSFFQYGLVNQKEELNFEILRYTQLLSNDQEFELEGILTDLNGNPLFNIIIENSLFYWLNDQRYEVTLDYEFSSFYDNSTGYYIMKMWPLENINLREGDYQLKIRISLENSDEDMEFDVDFTRTLDGVITTDPTNSTSVNDTQTTDITNSTSVNDTQTTDSVGGPQISIPAGLPGFELFYIFSIFALIPIIDKIRKNKSIT